MNETREKIIKQLENRDMNKRDFYKSGVSRQARSYHLPILMKEGVIKSYKKDGINFYTLIKRYEQPRDIIKLIEKIPSEGAIKTFKRLCITRMLGHRYYAHLKDGTKFIVYDGLNKEYVEAQAEKYVKIFSAGLNPDKLKEKLALYLTHIEDTDWIWEDGQTEAWHV